MFRLPYILKYTGLFLLRIQHLFQANKLFDFLDVMLQKYAASLSNFLQTFLSVI